MSDKIQKPIWRYIGTNLDFVPGIPARNLTQEEAEGFGIELIIMTGLYTMETDPEPVPETKTSNPAQKRKGK